MAERSGHLTLPGLWRRAVFLVCLGVLPCLCGATAAEPADKTGKGKGAVFSVLTVGGESLPEGLHWLESPGNGVPLKTSFVRRGDLLPAIAGQALVFGVPRVNPGKDEPPFAVLCTVPWPAGASERALVLLIVEKGRLWGVAIDDGETVFPRGTLRIINMVNRPLAARWGDFTWEVPPGPAPSRPYPLVPPGPAGQPGRFKVMLGVRWNEGNDANIIYAGRAEARADSRTLLVVREVNETGITSTGETVNVGVSYNTRWVVETLPKPSAAVR